MDELQRHKKLIQYLAEQTGLDQGRIERICYAGEPWTELERLSGGLLQAIRDAQETGGPSAAPFDVLHSLLKLEKELKEQAAARGRIAEDILRFKQRVDQISKISRESPETVQKVFSGILNYSYRQIVKARQSIKEGEKE